MKSGSRLRRTLNIYFLNLTLLLAQLSVAGYSTAASAEKPKADKDASTKFIPPGFTEADFVTLADRNKAADANLERERRRNDNKDQIEHDISSSSCRTFAASDSRRMEDITSYRALVGAQGYDEICRLRKKLSQQTGGPDVECGQGLELLGDSGKVTRDGQLQGAEEKYKTQSGETISQIDDQDWLEKKNQSEARLGTANKEVRRLRPLVPKKFSKYEAESAKCQNLSFIFCSREQRNLIATLKQDYQRSAQGLFQAEKELVAAQKHNDNYGKSLKGEKSNISSAQGDIRANEENMKESDGLSGVSEGAAGQLQGPVYQTNQALTNAINRYTQNAADFAEEKIAEVTRLEFANTNRGDYQLYELALQDISKNSRAGKVALSNLDVTAMASASIKKLKCSPVHDVDSKAYHIFRAASATYIAASISDTGSYSDFNSCIKDEIFNEAETSDTQFETVEKALNSHTQLVDTMCTTVNPDPDRVASPDEIQTLSREQMIKLKKICDASAGLTCADGQAEGCAPRTRETALEMYNTALMIAHQELADKRQLVSTAEANVKKGKKKIESLIGMIIKSNAIFILNEILSVVYTAIGVSLNGSICACGAPALYTANVHRGIYVLWAGLNAYYITELVRWKNFKKKWEAKLEDAQVHTHLACNGDDAKAKAAANTTFAEKAKADAVRAYEETKMKVFESIRSNKAGSLGQKTGLIKIPKWLKEKDKQELVSIYLKKYFQDFGKSTLDLLFPTALAKRPTQKGVSQTSSSAKALGMSMGSSSFYQFVLNQNIHWQDQAFDATKSFNSTSGYKIRSNPIVYCDQASSGNCINNGVIGMPTPETRVRLITNSVELVTENISLLLGDLNLAIEQREKYILLIKQMRRQMKLGDKGLDQQLEEKAVLRTASCMKEDSLGQYELDPNCKCQATNSCATSNLPEFGKFAPGVISDSESAVKKFTEKSLSGKLKEASLAAGELTKNANAVRRRIRKANDEVNKIRKENNKSALNFKKQAQVEIDKRRRASFNKYAKLFPSELAYENTRGGLGSFNNDFNLGAGKDSITPVKKNKEQNTNKKSSLAKGATDEKSNQDNLFDFDFDDEGTNEDLTDLAYLEKEERVEGNKVSRYKRKVWGSNNKKNKSDPRYIGINKDSNKNIFGIISGRYKKSAFPLFLEDMSFR